MRTLKWFGGARNSMAERSARSAKCGGLSVIRDDDRRSPPQTQSLRSALLGPCQLYDAERVYEGQIFPGPNVPIGAAQRKAMPGSPDHWVGKTLNEGASMFVIRLPKWST